MQPLISVIIPVYNAEPYLAACVESVLTQTYNNTEIILVDDGSPDNCPIMCDSYAEQDDRVRAIHKENGGLSTARNAGIDAATGEYLAFLDSDDLWSPYFLDRLYCAITETSADIAVCQFIRFSGDDIPAKPEKQDTLVFTQAEAFDCLFNYRNENMVIAPNKLYRRKIFKTIRYPVGKFHEDEAVIHEVIGAADRVAWVDEAHYYYRQTPGSITTAKFNLKRLDEMYAKEQRIAYFESCGMHELADRTKRVYLNNLMRLYRTILHQVEDQETRKQNCQMIYTRFCEVYCKKLVQNSSLTSKIRYILFKNIPVIYSRVEYKRLQKNELI